MQQIFIVGNLTRDAEAKSTTRQGVKSEFVSFTVACNEQSGDSDSATFYDVTMPKTAVLDYLKKGQKVAVSGRFQFSLSKDDNGKEWPHLNVRAQSVELAGAAKQKAEDLPEA
jgi:single-stranded DNA-binding protein